MSVSGSDSTWRDIEKHIVLTRGLRCRANACHVRVCRAQGNAIQLVYGVHKGVVKEKTF